MRYYIGVDMGGTTSTIGVGNERREVLHVTPQFETRSHEGPEAAVDAIAEQVIAAAETVGASISDVESVGLVTPGPATQDGVLLKSPNLNHPQWDRFPIRGGLERSLQEHHAPIAVHYLGDGQAAALGEYAIRRGALTSKGIEVPTTDQPISSLFMVIVGTGLGGGAVQEGRAVRGRLGRAGHAGHIMLPADVFRYPQDGQLRVGNSVSTAESAISLTGLTHQLEYRLGLESWRNHPLNSAPGTVRDKAKQLRGLAAEGDALALELFEDQARALGVALLCVNYIGDFDRLIIGGGVSDLVPAVRDRYLQLTEESYLQHALDGFQERGVIEFSICGDDAPVVGALAWVMDRP